jgi:hypothetical protein
MRLDWARFDQNASKTTHADMLANWWKYGFLIQQSDQIVETERNFPIP